MAKESGKKSFLDFFKMKDLDDDDEFDDDLFDDDDDDDDYDDYVKSRSTKSKSSFGRSSSQPEKSQTSYSSKASYSASGNAQSTAGYKAQSQNSAYGGMKQQARSAQNSKLVDFNNQRQQRADSFRGRSEVYVIKPQEISESQTVADFLKSGKTIVINMEGLELAPAQRIIDFIGGACYALDGTLQAISANIFIAAPNSIEVSGDLREEILNESTISPQLGQY